MSAHTHFLLYWVSQTLLTAVRLGLFEQLARGAQTPQQVAGALGLHPEATARLLWALTTLGYVHQQGGAYANTPAASLYLVSSSPGYVGAIAYQHAEQLWPLWEHLPTAVREGRPVLKEAFGGDRNPFDIMTASTEGTLKLIAGMHAGAKGFWEALARAHDFSQHRHVMDVGGCSGVVTGPIAQHFPHLRVTIFDIPRVCALLPQILPGYGCGDRIAAHAGDFFHPQTFPKGCDAAVICRVLHDWSDDKALAILRNLYAAMPPGGVVLIQENLLDTDDPAGRAFAALSNLTMLVMTDGGRERTAAEYESLLRHAGFHVGGTVRAAGPLAVVKGQKWVPGV